MDKIEELNKWFGVFVAKKGSDIEIEIRRDFVKLIKSRLENTNWDNTFSYVKSNLTLHNTQMVGPRILQTCYNECYQKMWSLNRKEGAIR